MENLQRFTLSFTVCMWIHDTEQKAQTWLLHYDLLSVKKKQVCSDTLSNAPLPCSLPHLMHYALDVLQLSSPPDGSTMQRMKWLYYYYYTLPSINIFVR